LRRVPKEKIRTGKGKVPKKNRRKGGGFGFGVGGGSFLEIQPKKKPKC